MVHERPLAPETLPRPSWCRCRRPAGCCSSTVQSVILHSASTHNLGRLHFVALEDPGIAAPVSPSTIPATPSRHPGRWLSGEGLLDCGNEAARRLLAALPSPLSPAGRLVFLSEKQPAGLECRRVSLRMLPPVTGLCPRKTPADTAVHGGIACSAAAAAASPSDVLARFSYGLAVAGPPLPVLGPLVPCRSALACLHGARTARS